MKLKYKFIYFNLVKDTDKNIYKLETTKAQKKLISDRYNDCIKKADVSGFSDTKIYACFAQLLGANTKYFKSQLSIALCSLFFDIYKYDKTYHSAQKFVFNLSGKTLPRETALELFSNSENRSGTISNFLDKKNDIKVEKDLKEFLSVFSYESMTYDMFCLLEIEKSKVKIKMKNHMKSSA